MWREMTEDDLTGSLTAAEIANYKKSGAWKTDPIVLLLERTAAMIRSYIRTNGKIVMSPNAKEVPESCIAPAMNYIAFDLTMRLGGNPTDGRVQARKDAVTFFQSISRRWINVEGYDSADDDTAGGPSTQVIHAEPSEMEHLKGL